MEQRAPLSGTPGPAGAHGSAPGWLGVPRGVPSFSWLRRMPGPPLVLAVGEEPAERGLASCKPAPAPGPLPHQLEAPVTPRDDPVALGTPPCPRLDKQPPGSPRQPPPRSELHLRCLPGGSHPCCVPSVSPLCPLWLQATARSPPKAAPAGTGTRGKRGSLAVPVAGCHQGRDPHRAPTSWGHGCGCSLGGTQVGAGLGSGSVLSPWVLSHPSHCPHSHLRGRMGMWHPKLIAPFLGRAGRERTT